MNRIGCVSLAAALSLLVPACAALKPGLTGHNSCITSISFNADGTRLVSGDQGGRVIVWNPDTGRQLLVLSAERQHVAGENRIERGGSGARGSVASVRQAQFTNDGQAIVVVADDIVVWSASSGEERLRLLPTLPPSAGANRFALSRDGAFVIVAEADFRNFIPVEWRCELWNIESGRRLVSRRYTDPIEAVYLDRESHLWACAVGDRVEYGAISGDENIYQAVRSGAIIQYCSVTADGSLMSIDRETELCLWALRDSGRATQARRIAATTCDEWPECIVDDAARMCAIGHCGYAHVVDLATQVTVSCFPIPLNGGSRAAFASAHPVALLDMGRRLLTIGGRSDSIQIWNCRTGDREWSVATGRETIGCAAVSSVRRIVATGGCDTEAPSVIRIWRYPDL